MVTQPQTTTQQNIIYPDSDGQPMADNTVQFGWIQMIYHNLAWLFAENSEVFVAGDLLWYPVEGDNKTRQAPDVMVVFGVEKGDSPDRDAMRTRFLSTVEGKGDCTPSGI